MSGSTGLLTERCDPYGAESAIRLVGGLYSEAHLGKHMWHCPTRADPGRYMMECPYGHRGDVMPLCTGHRVEVQRRQAGMCTRCAYPPEAAAIELAIRAAQADLGVAVQRMDRRETARIQQKIEDLRHHMTDMFHRGIIKRVPLRLIEVS